MELYQACMKDVDITGGRAWSFRSTRGRSEFLGAHVSFFFLLSLPFEPHAIRMARWAHLASSTDSDFVGEQQELCTAMVPVWYGVLISCVVQFRACKSDFVRIFFT